MYGEHANSDMIEIDSHNIAFLENEFPSIGEIKNNLKLYELHQDLHASLEGEDLNSRQATKDGKLLYPKGMGKICLCKRMRFVLNHELLWRINLRM